jgi:hypothetical protein
MLLRDFCSSVLATDEHTNERPSEQSNEHSNEHPNEQPNAGERNGITCSPPGPCTGGRAGGGAWVARRARRSPRTSSSLSRSGSTVFSTRTWAPPARAGPMRPPRSVGSTNEVSSLKTSLTHQPAHDTVEPPRLRTYQALSAMLQFTILPWCRTNVKKNVRVTASLVCLLARSSSRHPLSPSSPTLCLQYPLNVFIYF